MMFRPGEVTKTVLIKTNNDETMGPPEEYTIRLTPGPGILLGPQSEAVVTVIDNDGKKCGYQIECNYSVIASSSL